MGEYIFTHLGELIFCIGVISSTIYFIGRGFTRKDALEDMKSKAPPFICWTRNKDDD